MDLWEYRIEPAPLKGKGAKGIRGRDAKYANALSLLMNQLGAEGWEYQRADTLPCEERAGLTSKTTHYVNMLVFRRKILVEGDISVPQPDLAAIAVTPPAVALPASAPEWKGFVEDAEFETEDAEVISVVDLLAVRRGSGHAEPDDTAVQTPEPAQAGAEPEAYEPAPQADEADPEFSTAPTAPGAEIESAVAALMQDSVVATGLTEQAPLTGATTPPVAPQAPTITDDVEFETAAIDTDFAPEPPAVTPNPAPLARPNKDIATRAKLRAEAAPDIGETRATASAPGEVTALVPAPQPASPTPEGAPIDDASDDGSLGGALFARKASLGG